MAGRSRPIDSERFAPAKPVRAARWLLLVATCALLAPALARGQDPARTPTLYVHGFETSGAGRQGTYGTDLRVSLLEEVAARAGLPIADGAATLPPNAVAATTYYGSTPPPYYTPDAVGEIEAVTAQWGGGVPRYAEIVAKYARNLMQRCGAERVNLVSASFGSLIVRWLIEYDVGGLASEGKIARWLSAEGLVSGNWLASRDPLVDILEAFDPQPIDVDHMNYDWVSQHIHTPREEADNPNYARILLGQMVSTDDGNGRLSALMVSHGEYEPNDGLQVADDASFRATTPRSRLAGLPPTLGYFPVNHSGLSGHPAAWAQAANFLTQRRRVTITMTSARVTDLHEAHWWFLDLRPAEVVIASRVYSPAVAARWGIDESLSTLAQDGGIAPLHRFHRDGDTHALSQVLFDDFVLSEETQLRVDLHAEEIDYDWRYGVFETVQTPYYDDLGTSTVLVSTLEPGTYTFQSQSWNGTLTASIYDYPLAPQVLAGSAPDLGPSMLRARPNPHSGTVRIGFEGASSSGSPEQGALEVFDVAGRRVRRIEGDPRAGFVWDGRDESGAVLPSGIYLHRVTAPSGVWLGRSLLAR